VIQTLTLQGAKFASAMLSQSAWGVVDLQRPEQAQGLRRANVSHTSTIPWRVHT
jgi:hypothetical protein